MRTITVAGGGPAGAAAAIAVLRDGCAVLVAEKSKFPRHKVCGEFLSPEICGPLVQLGVWDEVAASGPAPIRKLALHFRRTAKRTPLPETAWGLSRYRLDDILLRHAANLGAVVERAPAQRAMVIAHGRRISAPKGNRLFGFKAHFEGPTDDSIELFFFDSGYVGVNPIEDSKTNVCGIVREGSLRDLDEVVDRFPPLAARLKPLSRSMKWMTTGPLTFRNEMDCTAGRGAYLAGDALSFVDPFTGSGLLAAVLTGKLAGTAAARNVSVQEYMTECRSRLRRPFRMSSILRAAIEVGWAEPLLPMIPAKLLIKLTRPIAA